MNYIVGVFKHTSHKTSQLELTNLSPVLSRFSTPIIKSMNAEIKRCIVVKMLQDKAKGITSKATYCLVILKETLSRNNFFQKKHSQETISSKKTQSHQLDHVLYSKGCGG